MAPIAAPNTTTLPEGSLQPTTTEQSGSRKVVSLIDTLLNSPTLPSGTTVGAQAQTVQSNELLGTGGLGTTTQAATPTIPSAPTATAQTTPTSQAVTAPTMPNYAATTAATVAGQTPTMTAAQGTVTQPMVAQTGAITSDATVRGQLANITQDIETSLSQGTALPAYLRGVASATRAAMAQRGLGASSMMAEALADGLLTASIPIAQADAQTYKDMIFQNLSNRQQAAITNANNFFQMDMANLSNNQQASLQNLQVSQAFLLSDQAAQNASRQFNATSENQVNQFYDNLSSQILQQNAARSDAMNQFALAEKNKISAINANNQVAVDKANADRQTQINTFNANLVDQRERFNVDNQRVIDQSNVQWRRSVNTANTAVVNATNQLNAQNLLNISNFALSAMWQQWRDEASWVNSSSQNELQRAHNAALAAIERSTTLDLADEASKEKFYTMLGRFGLKVIDNMGDND